MAGRSDFGREFPSWAVAVAIVSAALALPVSAAGGPAPAAAHTVPDLSMADQISLLLKVLTFDRTLGDRQGTGLRITVVEDPDSPQSRREAEAAEEELLRYSGQSLSGRDIHPERLHLHDLIARRAAGVDIAVLTPGLEETLPEILDWSRSNRTLTFGTGPTMAGRGVSIWVGGSMERPRIVINLVQVRAEGQDLDARLLALATVN